MFGATGQVAREVLLRKPDVTALSRKDADLADIGAVKAAIGAQGADLVINAAAYTAVDQAESEAEIAQQVNGGALREMGEACAAKGIPLVHISTDYVFDGSGSAPWMPDDETGPLSVYGASKRAGETALLESGADAVILRTSWVFSHHGRNFVTTMLRLGAERDKLTIVADQIGGPTHAGAIADAVLRIGRAKVEGHPAGGIYHFAGAEDTSWAGFAREIFAQAGLQCAVQDIPTSAYPTPAKRPLNSRLDCSALARDFGIDRPNWRKDLALVLKELTDA